MNLEFGLLDAEFVTKLTVRFVCTASLLSHQAEVNVKKWVFLSKQKFKGAGSEELCELSRLFSAAMCLFMVNGCTHVYIFTCMHSNQSSSLFG